MYFLQTWKTLPFVAVGLAREENNYIVAPGGILSWRVIPHWRLSDILLFSMWDLRCAALPPCCHLAAFLTLRGDKISICR